MKWKAEPWSLQTADAWENFSGKDIQEAIELFKEKEDYYAENLVDMPKSCLLYYVEAYLKYLEDEDLSVEDTERIWLGALVSRRKENLKELQFESLRRIERLISEWHLAEKRQIGSEFTSAKPALTLIQELLA